MLKRLYAILSVVLFAGIITAGWSAYRSMENFNRNENRQTLQVAINIVREGIENERSHEDINLILERYFGETRNRPRITIIDTSGEVLYDNESSEFPLENHLYRPEVYRAITRQVPSYSIRGSDTLGFDIFYLAQYIVEKDIVIRAAMPMDEYRESINAMGIRLLLILVISFSALLALGFILVKFVTAPLRSLATASDKISAGDYTARAKKTGDSTSEINRVSMSFNHMAEKLQTVIVDLEEKNQHMDIVLNSVYSCIFLIDDKTGVIFMNQAAREEFCDESYMKNGVYPFISIVRSQKAENIINKTLSDGIETKDYLEIKTRKGKKEFSALASPLKMKNEKRCVFTLEDVTQINKLQKMRSEFVANVSHELKTPLTSIRGFIDTLKTKGVNDPVITLRFLDIIDIEAERLHKLIQDILFLSEIEDMNHSTENKKFDLLALIDEVIVLLDDEALTKKISVISAITEKNEMDKLYVNADRNRIKQVLINLVENAIRYNMEGGKVIIEAERKNNDTVEIKVSDTGSGISEEHLPRVFERFYRADKGRSRELGGTGLGLSIVKHIAMLYNGSVNVSSKPGEGSIFTVNLKI